MKKLILAATTAVAFTAGPALAADLYKAPPMEPMPAVAAPPMFDVSFGAALTTDYILRGISQSNRRPAVQGYFEGQFIPSEYFTIYAGVWGSSLATYIADAEFDIYGGVRLSYDRFGLDIGYVHYTYPGGSVNGVFDYGEFYVKPSFKVTEWLTIGGSVYGTDNIFDSGFSGWYYTGNVAITLPQFMPVDITTVISGEIGRQTFGSGLGSDDYTTWNVGVAFGYKAMTLDLRYYDTDLRGTKAVFSPTGRNLANSTFVATLKFDTSLSKLP